MTNCLEYNIGVKAGYCRMVYPVGRLTVSENCLEINAFLLGNFVLSKFNITEFSIIGKGLFGLNAIEISHNISKYPRKIVIYTYRDPIELIRVLRDFSCNENSHKDKDRRISERIIEMQEQGSLPMKRVFLLLYSVFLILTVAYDINNIFFSDTINYKAFAWGTSTFYLITIFISIGLLFSNRIRNIFLKKGRQQMHVSRTLFIVIILVLYFLSLNLFMN
jgi:hypothetical protein